jgi:membrane associated rhomboid family serine protease
MLGVFPRELHGLAGILTAPLIHDDPKHAFANTIPLLVLGFLMYNAYRKVAVKSVVIIWLLSGIGIWIIGRPAYHIGASGVVFGINFFLFFSGIFRLDMRSLALSLLVAFAYGSMVWGIFPIDLKVSYEAHAMGALSGVLLAWWYREVDRPPEVRWEEEEAASDSASAYAADSASAPSPGPASEPKA